MRTAACEVAILKGDFPDRLKQLAVPTAGGPYAPVALSIAEDISAPDSTISLVHFTRNMLDPQDEIQARQNLQSTLETARNTEDIQDQLITTNDIHQSLTIEAQQSDILLIGAAKTGGIFDTAYFGGLPVEVAHKSAKPTLVVRSSEKKQRSWLQQIWRFFTDPLPNLLPEEQTSVIRSMQTAAIPSVDFFALILLAAGIASLGLLQNSAAVIIGAMLVAPLMSPILAMAMSIVLGNLGVLRVAAEATIKGASLAILVGIIMVIITPINAPTSEIIARTEPNVLDLMVALLSGMAAGYAVSRKQVAAALPGVAIAAALVPPLCVVGIGFGMLDLRIAFGALLLFTTNLVTIILAATFIFLALGITPRRSERGELLRGIRITATLLTIIFLILGYLTFQTIREQRQEALIRDIFYQYSDTQEILVEELDIEQTGKRIIISVKLLDFETNQLTTDQIVHLKIAIDKAIGENVTFRITTIPANFGVTNLTNLERESRLTDAFIIEVENHPVQIVSVESQYINPRQGYIVNSEIYSVYPDTLTESLLTGIQNRLSELMRQPVTLNLTILQGEQINILPIQTSSP